MSDIACPAANWQSKDIKNDKFNPTRRLHMILLIRWAARSPWPRARKDGGTDHVGRVCKSLGHLPHPISLLPGFAPQTSARLNLIVLLISQISKATTITTNGSVIAAATRTGGVTW